MAPMIIPYHDMQMNFSIITVIYYNFKLHFVRAETVVVTVVILSKTSAVILIVAALATL